jgi:hypothetical protein
MAHHHGTAYTRLDADRRGSALAVAAFAACAISVVCTLSTSITVASLAKQPFSSAIDTAAATPGFGAAGAIALHSHSASIPGPLPHKFALDLVTPRQLQLLRGACWIFALGGVLEHSYRKHAVAAGWMEPSHYLRMSEQNIGAVMTRACGAHPTVCMTGDDDEAYSGNSTEGGEVEWLYYLQRYVGSKVALPWSACPYVPTPTADGLCADTATMAASPISLTVQRMTTYYDLLDIKMALHASARAIALSMPLFVQNYRLPCTKNDAEMLQCDPHGPDCKPCPPLSDFADVACCIDQDRFGTNMHGEFSGGRPPGSPLVPAGGHAVVIAGYTDSFVSSMGYVGGLIIKNSWWDGVPLKGMTCKDPTAPCAAGRGSHTLGYFMGALSPIAERQVCPNVHSPDSWYACPDLATCNATSTALSAHAIRKVLRLKCLETGDRSPYVKNACTENETFYLKNSTKVGSGLAFPQRGKTEVVHEVRTTGAAHSTRFVSNLGCPVPPATTRQYLHTPNRALLTPFPLAYPPKVGGGLSVTCLVRADGGDDLCLPPLWWEDLALLFTPVDEEDRENDTDQCGFYLLPYEVFNGMAASLSQPWATDFEIVWSPASFAGAPHKHRGKGKDYTLIEKNTVKQRASVFHGPFPDLSKPL